MAEAPKAPLDAFADLLTRRPHPDAIPVAALEAPAVLQSVLTRFATAYPGAERIALVSLWSQFFFGRLMGPTIARMAAGTPTPMPHLDAVRVRLCPRHGIPLSFHVAGPQGAVDPAAAMAALLDGPVAHLIYLLQTQTGLSKRLLWANAHWSLAWTIREMDRTGAAQDDALTAIIACWEARKAGGRIERSPDSPLRRQVCCLRTRIPGFSRCPDVCPLATSGEAPLCVSPTPQQSERP